MHKKENATGFENLPRHIAIIMDGNGRWASKRLLPRTMGHREGMKAIKRVVEACIEIKVQALTLYAFSIAGIILLSQGCITKSLASGTVILPN
jgi:undecaprenyl diphosphate synthase